MGVQKRKENNKFLTSSHSVNMQGTSNTGNSWFREILKILVQIKAKLFIS